MKDFDKMLSVKTTKELYTLSDQIKNEHIIGLDKVEIQWKCSPKIILYFHDLNNVINTIFSKLASSIKKKIVLSLTEDDIKLVYARYDSNIICCSL